MSVFRDVDMAVHRLVDIDESLTFILEDLTPNERKQLAHEAKIAEPYFLQGLRGEELYAAIEEELKLEASPEPA